MGTSVEQLDKTYGQLLSDSLDWARIALDAFGVSTEAMEMRGMRDGELSTRIMEVLCEGLPAEEQERIRLQCPTERVDAMILDAFGKQLDAKGVTPWLERAVDDRIDRGMDDPEEIGRDVSQYLSPQTAEELAETIVTVVKRIQAEAEG